MPIKGAKELIQRLESMATDVQQVEETLNKTNVSTPVQPDKNGYVARACHRCRFGFKVATNNPSAAITTCPSCGYKDPDGRWETDAQREHAMENAKKLVKDAIFAALSREPMPAPLATAMEEATINIERGDRWTVVGLPARASAALRQQRTCPDCGFNYAFVGAAFFCPSCGTSSAEQTFRQSLEQVRASSQICRRLPDTLDLDEAANIGRALLEKGMADLVTSFQLVGERLYLRKTGTQAPQNAFQRLAGPSGGDSLWQRATGKDYVGYIGQAGIDRLHLYFQRRHILAHADGFVDQKYVDRSGDTAYAAGQRVTVTPDDLESFALLIEELTSKMMAE